VVSSAAAGDDDEAPVRELVSAHAEEEEGVAALNMADAEVDGRGVGDAGRGAEPRVERLGEERAREVGGALLEDAEVGTADVDEVAGGSADARRDREERDDQRDADRDTGRGQRRADAPPKQVPPDKPRPGHCAGFFRFCCTSGTPTGPGPGYGSSG